MPAQVSRLQKMALLENNEPYSPTNQHRDVGELVISFKKIKLVSNAAL
jgi:hypothetical protein